MERRRVVFLIGLTPGLFIASALSAQAPAKEATVTLAVTGMS